jgi:photosystem II stability/assembly factor-like uncharacterized protein
MSSGQGGWRQLAHPTTRDLFKLTFLDTARGWACGDGGVIITTTNGGANWIAQNTDIGTSIREIFMLDANHGWAISWKEFQDTLTFYGTLILSTMNGGDMWTARDFPVVGQYFHTIIFFDSANGLLGGEGGKIMHTSNGGATWNDAKVDSSLFMNFPVLNLDFYSNRLGFAMGGAQDFAGVIWRTTNGGERWIANGISPEPIYKLHFVDSLNIIGIVGDFDFGASMVRSTDGGQEWQYTYLGIFGQPSTMDFRTAAEGWVPLGNELMVTTDTANTWYVHDTLGLRRIHDLVFVDSITGYAVADSGYIFKYSEDVAGIEDDDFLLQPTFYLLQNYPNPFNPSTTIEFSIPSKKAETAKKGLHTTLRIYDLLGREVATLEDRLMTPGNHQVSFDARQLASGIYLYQLSSGGFVQTRKMLVVK